jgi:hypothetical protein
MDNPENETTDLILSLATILCGYVGDDIGTAVKELKEFTKTYNSTKDEVEMATGLMIHTALLNGVNYYSSDSTIPPNLIFK